MNTRKDRRGHHKWGSELLVKEVIMPVKSDQKDTGPSKDIRKFQEVHECRHLTHSSMKLGEYEVNAFCGLVFFKKPPVEDYVLGTKNKKTRIRKSKWNKYNPNTNPTFSDLFSQTSETSHLENESVRNSPQAAETLEGRILKANIERKIQNYENWMELQQEKNYRRQRHLEKESLKQQEHLAGTWLGFIQSKKERREKNLEEGVSSISPLVYKRRHDRPANISKKYWNDETDEKTQKKFTTPGNGKEKKKVTEPLPVALDELKGEFFEKLVFIDDSDDDPG